jgi:hypothetical protein
MKLTAKLNGTGNVFDNIHFTKITAARFKKDLAGRMTSRMKERRLTLQGSAEKVGCVVDDIRDIRKSDVSGFEIAELIGLARKLGFEVKAEISIPDYEMRKVH